MNDLTIIVKEHDGRIVVSGRELHDALMIRTKYAEWMKRMIRDFEFVENQDYFEFFPNLGKTSQGGRPASEHLLTVDMAKEVCMITRNGQGKEIRKYFIQVERDWNTPEKIIQRALTIANATIHDMSVKMLELESRPTVQNASNEELISELNKRLA